MATEDIGASASLEATRLPRWLIGDPVDYWVFATTLIGGTCKHSNVFSGPVLIARGLDFERVVARKRIVPTTPTGLSAGRNHGWSSSGNDPRPLIARRHAPRWG
jgi:hypothetical protein